MALLDGRAEKVFVRAFGCGFRQDEGDERVRFP
jgi:hypothetical protein